MIDNHKCFHGNSVDITTTQSGQHSPAGIAFPGKNSSVACPVCGYHARIIHTDADRSWAEIECENCGVYAITKNALNETASTDLYLLSGYYCHAYHEPMVIPCDNQESVKRHIEETRCKITRDYQLNELLRHYYQKMERFGQTIVLEKLPAIVYAENQDELMDLIAEAEERKYIEIAGDTISVTKAGKDYMDRFHTTSKPTVFISYNWGSDTIAEEIENQLKPYAEVKRDKSSVPAWGDLTEFMDSIRDQDFAVLIISDAYLKSEGCLYEVVQLMKDANWDERVMYVVTEDAQDIYSTEKQLQYITYWEERTKKLEDAIREHNPADVIAQIKDQKIISQISQNIGEFMAKVKSVKNPDLQDVVQAVVDRVRNEESNAAETVVNSVSGFRDIIVANESLENKGLHDERGDIAESPVIIEKDCFLVAVLLGSWNENYEGDLEIIEKLSGKKREVFIKDIREIYAGHEDVVSFSEGKWTIINARKCIESIASKCFDDTIDNLFATAAIILQETDPKYDLPQKKRDLADLYLNGNKKRYSYELLSGVSETIAIMGNNSKLFKHCSRNKISNSIYELEKKIFSTEDWKVYATISDSLQNLAEANPKYFLDNTLALLEKGDAAFAHYLKEKSGTLIPVGFGYQMGVSLCMIAMDKNYFADAMSALMLMAELQERFLDSAIEVVLPWYPQTNADASTRIGFFKGFSKTHDGITWKALMKLMPNATTSSSPHAKPEYLKVDDFPESVPQDVYDEALRGYIEIALGMLHGDEERICQMVGVLDDVDESIRGDIIAAFDYELKEVDETGKERIWNSVQDLLNHHRRFSDAEWALSEDDLKTIDQFAEALSSGTDWKDRRLFRNDQFSLRDRSDDLHTAKKLLEDKQKNVLRNYHEQDGSEGVMLFADTVQNKNLVGSLLADILTDEEIKTAIDNTAAILENDIIGGLISRLSPERLETVLKDSPERQKAEVLSYSGLTDEWIKHVKEYGEDARDLYWDNVKIYKIKLTEDECIEETIDGLNKSNRPEDSVLILEILLHDDVDIKTDWVVDTLEKYLEKMDYRQQDTYSLQELIKWLQKSDVDKEKMESIEWGYLVLLDSASDCAPLFLWDKMSSEPGFYVEVLEKVYNVQLSEDNRNITDHCLKLLWRWKKIPALTESNSIDHESLRKWVEEVSRKSEEKQLFDRALYFFGKTTFYAPKDKDGFFIDRTVADVLEDEKEGYIRRGYENEAINSYGVHNLDPTGKPEFEIEEKYREKAEQAEKEGYLKFAKSLRAVADFFHQLGEDNSEW